MASLTLSQVAGGGGVFRTESFSFGNVISSGVTGDLVTIGTSGKVSKLTHLTTDTGTLQGGIGITVDGVAITGLTDLSDESPINNGAFFVSENLGTATVTQGVGKVSNIVGEFIIITKTAGNTTQDIIWSAETGSIK